MRYSNLSSSTPNHILMQFVWKLIISPSAQVSRPHSEPYSEKIKAHFKCSFLRINIHKVSFCTKPMMHYNFVICFIPLSLSVFKIRMSNSAALHRWRRRWFNSVEHGNFTEPSSHFYNYGSCCSEVIWDNIVH